MFLNNGSLALIYFTFFVVIVLNRDIDLAWIAIAAQLLFSGQILLMIIRIAFLKMEAERIYDLLYENSVSDKNKNAKEFEASVMNLWCMYETTKARANLILSSSVFKELNPSLSKKWDEIQRKLKL